MPPSLDTPMDDNAHGNPHVGYRLRWKGKVTGPFTRVRIEELLHRGEISLLHSIEYGGEWHGLDSFLGRSPTGRPSTTHPRQPVLATPFAQSQPESRESDSAEKTPPHRASARVAHAPDPPPPLPPPPTADVGVSRFDLVKIGYILCGLCFLLPFFATIPALFTALELHERSAPASEHAKKILYFAIALTLLGAVFWILVHYLFRNPA